jgi:HAD superfamily hydrolase (TIGR01509 family)
MIATLFDFNGVLVDDELVHLEAFREVLRPRGVAIDKATYVERYLGFDDAEAFRAILVEAGHRPTDAEVHMLVEAKKPVYMTMVAGALRVFPGASELVARRAARGPVGIVSGALAHEIEFALAKMGVRPHVAFVVSAEDTPACKPHPMGYRLGAERAARLGADRVVVLEDSKAGVQAAKAAGLRCVAVAHSYPVATLVSVGADAVALDLVSLDDDMLDGAVS